MSSFSKTKNITNSQMSYMNRLNRAVSGVKLDSKSRVIGVTRLPTKRNSTAAALIIKDIKTGKENQVYLQNVRYKLKKLGINTNFSSNTSRRFNIRHHSSIQDAERAVVNKSTDKYRFIKIEHRICDKTGYKLRYVLRETIHTGKHKWIPFGSASDCIKIYESRKKKEIDKLKQTFVNSSTHKYKFHDVSVIKFGQVCNERTSCPPRGLRVLRENLNTGKRDWVYVQEAYKNLRTHENRKAKATEYSKFIGKKIGKLTVINIDFPNFICRCECSKLTSLRIGQVTGKSKAKKSCGCDKLTNEIDRLNTKINQLTIKSIAFKLPDKGNYDYVLCQCDCGNVKILRYGNILNKNTKTCGCGPRGPKIGSKSKRRKPIQ